MPVTIDMTALDKLRTLGPSGQAGIDTAVKRVGSKSRGVICEVAGDVYNIDKKTMSKGIYIPRNTPPLTVDVTLKGNRQPMYLFSPQPNQPFSGGTRPYAVSVNITGLKFVHQDAGHDDQYAFIAKMASGHTGIFERRKDVFGRVPKKGLIKATSTGFKINAGKTAKLERIQEMFTLAYSQMMNEKVYPEVKSILEMMLNVETEKEYGKAVKAIFKEWAGS